MRIIALAGYAGSGKDTIGKALKKQLAEQGVYAASVGISDRIIETLAYLLDMDCSVFDSPNGKALPAVVPNHPELNSKSNRELLQDYANAIRAKFGDAFWIEEANAQLQCFHGAEVGIITGIRLDAEVAWLRTRYGRESVFAISINREGVGPANGDRTEAGITNEEFINVGEGPVEIFGAAVRILEATEKWVEAITTEATESTEG